MTNNDDDLDRFISTDHHDPGHQADVCARHHPVGVLIYGEAGSGTMQAITGYLHTFHAAIPGAGSSAPYIKVMPYNKSARSHLQALSAAIMNALEEVPHHRQEFDDGD